MRSKIVIYVILKLLDKQYGVEESREKLCALESWNQATLRVLVLTKSLANFIWQLTDIWCRIGRERSEIDVCILKIFPLTFYTSFSLLLLWLALKLIHDRQAVGLCLHYLGETWQWSILAAIGTCSVYNSWYLHWLSLFFWYVWFTLRILYKKLWLETLRLNLRKF